MIYTIPEHDVVELENLIHITPRVQGNRPEQLSNSQDLIYRHRDSVLPNIFIEYYSTTHAILNKKLSEVLEIENINPIQNLGATLVDKKVKNKKIEKYNPKTALEKKKKIDSKKSKKKTTKTLWVRRKKKAA